MLLIASQADLVVPFLVLVSSLLFLLIFRRQSRTPTLTTSIHQNGQQLGTIPTYGSRLLPPFVNGISAAMKLGSQEDDFLLGLKRTYGSIVYIPWPLAQYFILSSKPINTFYSTPQKSLSFLPVRLAYQESIFGCSKDATPEGHGFFVNRFYPLHARGLTKSRLRDPILRFNTIFATKVAELRSQVEATGEKGHLDVPIVAWLLEAMFDAGLGAIFGLDFLEKSRETGGRQKMTVQEGHNLFDAAFGILASEMVPWSLRRFVPLLENGIIGRESVSKALEEFIVEGMPGLQEGFLKEVAEFMLSQGGMPPAEVAHILLGDLWALQANAPFACIALFVRVFQCPGDLVENIRSEIEKGDIVQSAAQQQGINFDNLNDSTPLMTSCINETLRLETSAFSIRIAQEDFLLNVSESEETPRLDNRHVVIPRNSKIIAATRVPHLTDPIWGDNPECWEPERFLLKSRVSEEDDQEEDMEKRQVQLAKLLKELRGFGGGVSMCEGRHLAVLELKSALTHFIMNFDMVPLIEPGTESEYTRIKFKDTPTTCAGAAPTTPSSFGPKKNMTRPGLGAFQFVGDMVFRVSLRS